MHTELVVQSHKNAPVKAYGNATPDPRDTTFIPLSPVHEGDFLYIHPIPLPNRFPPSLSFRSLVLPVKQSFGGQMAVAPLKPLLATLMTEKDKGLGKADVAVVLSEELRNGPLEVDRRCDRLMRVRVLMEGDIINLISNYTPQAGCSGSEIESFWEQFEEVLRAIPAAEVIIVGGDLNGHVDRAADTVERVHGGFGYGGCNAEGENILRTCFASDLAVVNTFFQKTPQHLITYKSGSHSTQLDYLLTRRCHI
nr:craniofacial development protein 2-like [Danaus plexippus plexippus]